jgi:ATP-dependent helicase/nuclease subunit A
MPTAELTTEQQSAIDTRNASIALSAGAGCGKTHVLTARFLSHLDRENRDNGEPARLGQLIAITFTDAAAREMRTRIRGECFERLQSAQNDDEAQHWLRLLREIDAARISTIHAFCASLLRTYAAEAGLDPTFGVLDQSDADVLQYDVIDDVLREMLDESDADTLDLAAAYDLRRVKQQVAELLGRRHDAAFQDWLTATPEQVLTAWQDWHEVAAFPNALTEIADAAPIAELIDLLQSVTPEKPAFIVARATLLELLPRLAEEEINEAELDLIRQSAQVQKICTAKDWSSADDYGLYRDACKNLRDTLDKYRPKPFSADAARETAELGLALLKLTNRVAVEYDERKHAQGMLDFDDLLAAAHGLVTDSQNAALTEQLADDLRLLLVDEFQDTDHLQADLVRALCGAGFNTGRLFFVGDFKQSIYRFRGAEPKVFRDLREQVKKKGRLPLTLNFRSQPQILHFVNALFCDAFGRQAEPYERLDAKRDQVTEPPAIEFLWTEAPNKNNRRLPGAALEARRQEATAIARRIRSLVDHSEQRPVVDRVTDEPRRLELGDIAILFRTLGDVQVYEEALREYELDYYLVGGYAFYAQQEIYDVLNLLRAVASTADELSLAGVLRSPFFALTDETLFWLADTAGSINAGLFGERLPPQLSTEERTKAEAAAATLRQLRSIKDSVPIAALLEAALDRTGYDAVLLTEFLGERKLANLNKLVERARAADHGGMTDLDGFLTQLSQFVAREPKESLAATLPEASNVIRLMTIHHAKGLEFPLVVLPDLDRLPRFGVASAALHPTLGPLVPRPTDDEREAATGISMFAALERREELEERKRMLYVATTRARDYLILSSSLEAFDKPTSDWTKLIAERFDLQTGELLTNLPKSYEPPTVRVTTDPQTDHKPSGRSRGPDLLRMLEDAHQLAADGRGIVPATIAPIPVDRAARRQFSFSRLSGKLVSSATTAGQSPGATAGSPSSAADAQPLLDPRGLGSLTHDVLARIDFSSKTIKTEIAEWCEHLAPQYVVHNADDAASLSNKMIAQFIASPRGRELSRAKALHREVGFLLAWPHGHANEGRYMSGDIDCLYQDADNVWRIVDYKTNDVSKSDIARTVKRYEMQLYVYAMAAEQALGTSPTELVLELLRPGIEHKIPWNETARRHAIDMVNEAIEAALYNLTTEDDLSELSTLDPRP